MRQAVALAARATRFVQSSTALDGISKDDRSPVTIADWASQAVVAMTLGGGVHPCGGTPLVGEEDAAALRAPASEPLLARVVEATSHALGRAVTRAQCLEAIDSGRAAPCARFFTLDPVDGTKGFLRRQQYAISLALIEGGAVTLGVVGCPNLPAHDPADYDAADPLGCIAYAALGTALAGGGGRGLSARCGVSLSVAVGGWKMREILAPNRAWRLRAVLREEIHLIGSISPAPSWVCRKSVRKPRS